MRDAKRQRASSVPGDSAATAWERGYGVLRHQTETRARIADMVARIGRNGDGVPPSALLSALDRLTSAAVMAEVYRTHGQIWTIVVPKADVPELLSPDEARRAVTDGGIDLEWAGLRRESAELLLVAVGAYQLEQAVAAARRLGERSIAHASS